MKTGHSRKYTRLLPEKKNRKCGKKEHRLAPVRKGLLTAALNNWLVNNGHGLCAMTRNASIQYFPNRKAV